MQNYALTKVGDRERAAFPIKMPFFLLAWTLPSFRVKIFERIQISNNVSSIQNISF